MDPVVEYCPVQGGQVAVGGLGGASQVLRGHEKEVAHRVQSVEQSVHGGNLTKITEVFDIKYFNQEGLGGTPSLIFKGLCKLS